MKGLVGFQQRVLGILNKDTGGARKGKVLERGGEKNVREHSTTKLTRDFIIKHNVGLHSN